MASNPHYNHGLLWRALAISLLLHAVLLLQPRSNNTASHPASAPSLMALLMPKSATEPHNEPAPAVARRTAQTPALVPVARDALPVSTPAAAHDQGTDEGLVTTEGSLSQPATAGTAAATHAPVAASADNETDFAEARKGYLFSIAAEARRVKKYPPRAFAAGWTGTAEILIVVGSGGITQMPRLRKSSGYADIDNAALSFVGMALSRTPVPEKLRGRSFEFILPVSFSIDEQ